MADPQEPNEQRAEPTPKRWQRLYGWLDQRTGIQAVMHEALDEPIPGGARWAYVFGSVLLFLFISQAVTGVALALYYAPTADHAHTTVAYIVKVVTAGSFLRSLHAYGSSAVVVVMLLHLTQTFLYGAYKGRREVLWLSGCALLGLMLAMAFTGYLLPWDQKAYFATTVGTNMASEVPWIGAGLKRLMRGGNEMGTLTLSRFFVAHVFLLPAAIMGLIASHIFLFRKAGAAGPPSADAIAPNLPTQRFYPRQVLMDTAVALLMICALAFLAHFHPIELGPKANPADTQFVPRPEWYYLPVFQWLKYFKGSLAIVGIVVVPSLTALLVLALPFLDRSLERRPWKRPFAVGIYLAILATLITFGLLSKREDRLDPAIAKQVARQDEETRKFMNAPFEPEAAASALSAPAVVVLDPLAAAGKKIFQGQSCDACHGENGIGTEAGPKLVGLTAQKSPEQVAQLLHHPDAAMLKGGMQSVTVTDEEMKALVAYLQSLK